MNQERQLVFVYGTLRRGASNAFRLAGADCLGSASVRGELYRIDWYPGLVLTPDGPEVVGEIWEVGPALLTELDAFEGVSTANQAEAEYRRVRVIAQLNPETTRGQALEPRAVWVWEWLGPCEEGSRIVSGDWFDVEPPKGQ